MVKGRHVSMRGFPEENFVAFFLPPKAQGSNFHPKGFAFCVLIVLLPWIYWGVHWWETTCAFPRDEIHHANDWTFIIQKNTDSNKFRQIFHFKRMGNTYIYRYIKQSTHLKFALLVCSSAPTIFVTLVVVIPVDQKNWNTKQWCENSPGVLCLSIIKPPKHGGSFASEVTPQAPTATADPQRIQAAGRHLERLHATLPKAQ